MRESFGGTFMIQLSLIFIVIYVSFMAVAFNYAKAFRVKNGVINIIEQYQYDGTANDEAIGVINEYLSGVAYSYGNNISLKDACLKEGNNLGSTATFTDTGACIIPLGDEKRRYYRVTTYIPINFPFFDLSFHVSVSGETKIVSDYT